MAWADRVRQYWARGVGTGLGRQGRAIFAADVLGLLALCYIAYVDLAKFDTNWDNLAYHMPFAALRMGLMSGREFVLPSNLQAYYAGFPRLADDVQGFLWMITGRPEAVSLISAIAPACLALYMRVSYRLGLIWTVLVFVAVPILHANLDSGYVDLWTNAFFTVFLFAAWRLVTAFQPGWRQALLAGLALAVAVNSKEQYFIIGGFAYAVTLVLAAGRMRGGRLSWAPPAVFLLLAPVVFCAPLRDWLLFSDPIYPAPIHQAAFAAERGIWDMPVSLRNESQPIRFLLSELDLNATDMRPNGYTIDQGNVPAGAPGDRMGGSLSVLVLGFAAVLGRMLVRVPPRREQMPAILGAMLLLGLVSVFPASNELRYVSFVEIVLILATLCLLREEVASGDAYVDGLRFAARALLVSGAIYTSFITGFTHLLAPRIDQPSDIMKALGVTAVLDAALQKSHVVCYDRPDPNAVLYAPIFHRHEPGGPYVLLAYWTGSPLCPVGSAVIR